MSYQNPLKSGLDIDFYDLYNAKGLEKVDLKFHEFFSKKNHELYNDFLTLKNNQQIFPKAKKIIF